jgi:hypothetical protein
MACSKALRKSSAGDKPVAKNVIKTKNGLRPKNRGKQKQNRGGRLLLDRQKPWACGLA